MQDKFKPIRLRYRPKPGAIPGSLLIKPEAPQTRIHLLAYGEINFIEKEIQDVKELETFLNDWPVVWVSIEGFGNEKLLTEVANFFEIHRLTLEDVVNTPQRSKAETFDDKMFLIQRLVKGKETIELEQLSMVFSEKFVITFQETSHEVLKPLKERIRMAKGHVRHAKGDYLAYLISDAILDNYFPVLEQYSEKIEELEAKVVYNSQKAVIRQIHSLKRDLLTLKRSIWPQREAISAIIRSESPVIAPETRIYFRDCQDLVVQNIDLIETYRELTSGLLDIHLTTLSKKTNEVMRVLTVIATLFIPLTFITGIYGMNFNSAASPYNLPELNWYWGYPFALGLMGATAGALLLYFKNKKWL